MSEDRQEDDPIVGSIEVRESDLEPLRSKNPRMSRERLIAWAFDVKAGKLYAEALRNEFAEEQEPC